MALREAWFSRGESHPDLDVRRVACVCCTTGGRRPGKESGLPLPLRKRACVCYTTGTSSRLVGDPRLALSLCLFPKQVGRCLPMSPLVRPRGLEPPCLAASAPRPDVSTGFHHGRESLVPGARCERGILLLEEPGVGDAGLRVARSLRAYETREATAPALPQGVWWARQELHLHAGGHPLLRRACLLVPPRAREWWFREESHLQGSRGINRS